MDCSSTVADAPLRIEEPFKGKRLADMRLLMLTIYRCMTCPGPAAVPIRAGF